MQVVQRIITQAVRQRASDVHVEPQEGKVRIRFRVDGALHDAAELPPSIAQALEQPHQDHGRDEHRRASAIAGRPVRDDRRRSAARHPRRDDGHDLGREGRAAAARPQPLVVPAQRTGHVGAGAGRLLALDPVAVRHGDPGRARPAAGRPPRSTPRSNQIADPERNITTIEDPVEYVFPGINQIQINEQADITFAGGLKAILRQDPDVILVGEMRDVETARIAVQSALTGHLVLSSLHATDCDRRAAPLPRHGHRVVPGVVIRRRRDGATARAPDLRGVPRALRADRPTSWRSTRSGAASRRPTSPTVQGATSARTPATSIVSGSTSCSRSRPRSSSSSWSAPHATSSFRRRSTRACRHFATKRCEWSRRTSRRSATCCEASTSPEASGDTNAEVQLRRSRPEWRAGEGRARGCRARFVPRATSWGGTSPACGSRSARASPRSRSRRRS